MFLGNVAAGRFNDEETTTHSSGLLGCFYLQHLITVVVVVVVLVLVVVVVDGQNSNRASAIIL